MIIFRTLFNYQKVSTTTGTVVNPIETTVALKIGFNFDQIFAILLPIALLLRYCAIALLLDSGITVSVC